MSAPDRVSPWAPSNFLRPCLLLLLAEGPSHGYDLLDQLAELGLARVDPSGLYRGLREMERQGLVRSWWEPSEEGPARRTYTLTDEGMGWLSAWSGAMHELRLLTDRIITRYESTPAGKTAR